MSMSPEVPVSLFADMARFVWQSDGAAALRLTALTDAPAGRTLSGLHVHASTTCHTLTRALAEAAPSVAAALTTEDFTPIAQAFIVAHPPRRADLHGWGDDLPDYLARQNADPCLVAWARLDRAWFAALFAPEAQPIEPARLSTLPPADILQARLTSHPSLRLVRLADPWLASWLDLGAVAQVESDWQVGADGRHIALTRPGVQVRAVALSPLAYGFLDALHQGQTLVQAYEIAHGEDAAFDLQSTLASLFSDGLFTDVLTGMPSHDDE
jgi:hypothetical protein